MCKSCNHTLAESAAWRTVVPTSAGLEGPALLSPPEGCTVLLPGVRKTEIMYLEVAYEPNASTC